MRPPVKFWWSHAAFPHPTQGKTAADFRVDPNAAQHARGRDYRLGPQPVHRSAPEAVPATAEPVAIPGPARTASRRAGVFPGPAAIWSVGGLTLVDAGSLLDECETCAVIVDDCTGTITPLGIGNGGVYAGAPRCRFETG
jgi:hypothetical protein